MFWFSCFHSHVHYHKQKKPVELSAEEMHKTLEDCSETHSLENRTYSAVTNSSHPKMEGDNTENGDYYVTESPPIEKDLKSEEIEWISDNDDNVTSCIKKSRSLGSGLDLKGKASGDSDSQDETDQRYSSNGSRSLCDLIVPGSSKDFDIFMPNQSQEAMPSDSFQESSEVANIDSIFSISDPQHPEKVQDTHDIRLSGGGECSDHTPHDRIIVKSTSLPIMHFPVCHFTCSLHRSRSAQDLNVLDARRKEMSTYEIQEERDDRALNNGKSNSENVADYCSDVNNYDGLAKDWIIPVLENINTTKHHQKEFSSYSWNELPSKVFQNKRLEEWVKDLQHYSPDEVPEEETILDVSPAARVDGKVNPSMEGVKKYISSLNATSTSAQLKNHGLVVMPFLSAFTSLRELNLSGNDIVRITAGTLPRGLHVLNLSKNKISTIEGLRELARLRVLDLSYNRILRIGHGLASCSSLKELYLAGNKISEVEGVHRLLKLIVLDLRFNKISTAKCLGQLAANYNSLQAVSLEGNPAQKNVGDEQLKKHLLCLLPHLAYYNRQPIKVGTLKDAADRATRLGINTHQSGRNLRAELKMIRKGTQGVAANKTSSSSIHARKSQAIGSSKASRGRSIHLPPTGTKTSTVRHHFHDFSNKLLNSKLHSSIPRSRSEGTLGVL